MTRWSYWNLVAAGPLFLLALNFVNVWMSGTPTFHPLARVLRVEILAVQCLPLTVAVTSYRADTFIGKAFKGSVAVGLFVLYAAIARAVDWQGLLLFVSLTLATYAGFVLHAQDKKRQSLLALRWLIGFLLFVIVGAVTGLPEDLSSWERSPSTLYAGTIYFGALGLLEGIGFYEARVGSPAIVSRDSGPS